MLILLPPDGVRAGREQEGAQQSKLLPYLAAERVLHTIGAYGLGRR